MDQDNSKNTPAFQFYPNDFLSDKNVMMMTPEEIGVYWMLICVCWKEKFLSNNLEDLAYLVRVPMKRFNVIWEKKIKRCFLQNDEGNWVHPWLEAEMIKQKERSIKQSEAGKNGAKVKWGLAAGQRKLDSEKVSNSKQKGSHSQEEWEEMKLLTKMTCVKCLKASPEVQIVKDHITPIYQGGSDTISNIQPLCSPCKSYKGSECVDYRNSVLSESEMPSHWIAEPSIGHKKRIAKDSFSSSSSSSSSNTNTKNICPTSELLEKYHEFCPSLSRVQKLTDARSAGLRARWKDHSDLIFWETFFKRVEKSDFLTGRIGSSNGDYRVFKADFAWILKEEKFLKILEGFYDNRDSGGSGERAVSPAIKQTSFESGKATIAGFLSKFSQKPRAESGKNPDEQWGRETESGGFRDGPPDFISSTPEITNFGRDAGPLVRAVN